jgi:WD40 repeat protein
MRKLFAALFVVVLIALHGHPTAGQTLYDQPVLIVDPDMHTGRIKSVAVAESGKFAVTGSFDKTIRIWDMANGELKKTLRMPAGPGNIGKVYAVAISPESNLVAVGGWTSGENEPEFVYLFDPDNSAIVARISGLPDVVNKLAFSKDGRYLAAAVGTAGLRVFDRERHWDEAFSDPNYSDRTIYGLSFARDGRLATSSYDRKIRLYGPGPDFKFVVSPKNVSADPHEIAFRPDGEVLAVGYSNPSADLLDGHDLHALPGPNTSGLSEKLSVVSWARDGTKLFIGGGPNVFVWDNAGLGEVRVLPGGDDTIMSMCTSDDGSVLIAVAGPLLKFMNSDGNVRWQKITPIARLESQGGILSTSRDGSIVDFGYTNEKHPSLRFDMKKLTLTHDPPADGLTTPPTTTGLPIKDWRNSFHPTFNGAELKLEDSEESRSMAISPNGQRFVFGTTWTLRARDANNQPIWHRDVGDVWAVNVTGDGRWVVAAYDDGTIRWHRLDTGEEMLALMVLHSKKGDGDEWVAWTREGYYVAKGAFGVLRWHANSESDSRAFATAIPAASIADFNHPDVLPLILDTMDVSGALKLAKRAASKEAVKKATGMSKLPGARLHVLAIGINYSNWESLTLRYPEQDASDLIKKLQDTQGSRSGMYAEVKYHYLNSANATRSGIIKMMDVMQGEMHTDDVAVVMYSGHGTLQGSEFHFLASDVNVLTKAGVKAGEISASDFHEMIVDLASKGRVLVLLDACHAGKIAENESLAPNAEALRNQLTSVNTAILTSSTGSQVSFENPDWKHGAFTKVFLEALSGADKDHNGIITIDELIDYLAAHLGPLTKDAQQLGVSNHATGDIFVADF